MLKVISVTIIKREREKLFKGLYLGLINNTKRDYVKNLGNKRITLSTFGAKKQGNGNSYQTESREF